VILVNKGPKAYYIHPLNHILNCLT